LRNEQHVGEATGAVLEAGGVEAAELVWEVRLIAEESLGDIIS
jgi:hypothetical protein